MGWLRIEGPRRGAHHVDIPVDIHGDAARVAHRGRPQRLHPVPVSLEIQMHHPDVATAPGQTGTRAQMAVGLDQDDGAPPPVGRNACHEILTLGRLLEGPPARCSIGRRSLDTGAGVASLLVETPGLQATGPGHHHTLHTR